MLDEEQEAPAEEEAEAEAPAEQEAEAEASAEEEAEAPAEEEAEPEAPAEADLGVDSGDDDEEEKTMEPEVQEYIGQDSTVVHHKSEEERSRPSEWRTGPGVAPGIDPGTIEERNPPPRPSS